MFQLIRVVGLVGAAAIFVFFSVHRTLVALSTIVFVAVLIHASSRSVINEHAREKVDVLSHRDGFVETMDKDEGTIIFSQCNKIRCRLGQQNSIGGLVVPIGIEPQV